MNSIRLIEIHDWDKVWSIIEPVFRAGETYSFPTDISKEQAFTNWIEYPLETYVFENENGNILGTYYIKPNQQGPGSHVCNCGYIVSEHARGRGVARKMGEHSLLQAKNLGFHAMQYNLVVSTNTVAVKLWESLGLEIKGVLPDAYNHKRLGFVDALVMYKIL